MRAISLPISGAAMYNRVKMLAVDAIHERVEAKETGNMGLDRLPEILGLLVLGLIIFGPKRMIELGGQVGRALRELQTAMKEMNWNLTGDDAATSSSSSQTTLGKLSQIAQDISGARAADAAPVEKPHVVEAAAPQPMSDPPAE